MWMGALALNSKVTCLNFWERRKLARSVNAPQTHRQRHSFTPPVCNAGGDDWGGATVTGAPKGGHHYLTPSQPVGCIPRLRSQPLKTPFLWQGTGQRDGARSRDHRRGRAARQWQPTRRGRLQDVWSCVVRGCDHKGLSLQRGGWFTLLATNVTGLRVEGTNVTAQRDGLDVVGCRDVLVNNVRVDGGGDDAMVFGQTTRWAHRCTPAISPSPTLCLGSGCNGPTLWSETAETSVACCGEHQSSRVQARLGSHRDDGRRYISDVTYRNISIKGACVAPPRPFHHAYTGVHKHVLTPVPCPPAHSPPTHAASWNTQTQGQAVHQTIPATRCTRQHRCVHSHLQHAAHVNTGTPCSTCLWGPPRRPGQQHSNTRHHHQHHHRRGSITQGGFGAKGNVTSTANGLPANGTTHPSLSWVQVSR